MEFNLKLGANIEVPETDKGWSTGQIIKHAIFGGKEVQKISGQEKKFIYKYDGLLKRMAGITLGVLTRGVGYIGRAMGLNKGTAELNPFASKDWQKFKQEQAEFENGGCESSLAMVSAAVKVAFGTSLIPSEPTSPVGSNRRFSGDSIEDHTTSNQALTAENQELRQQLLQATEQNQAAEVNIARLMGENQELRNEVDRFMPIPPVQDDGEVARLVQELERAVAEESNATTTEIQRPLLESLENTSVILKRFATGASVATLAALAMNHPKWAPACYEMIKQKLGGGIQIAVKVSGEASSYAMELVLNGQEAGEVAIKGSLEQLQTFAKNFGSFVEVKQIALMDLAREMIATTQNALNNLAANVIKHRIEWAATIQILSDSLKGAIQENRVGLGAFGTVVGLYLMIQKSNDLKKLAEKIVTLPSDGSALLVASAEVDTKELSEEEKRSLLPIVEMAQKHDVALKLTAGAVAVGALSYVAYQNREALSAVGGQVISTVKGSLEDIRESLTSGSAVFEQLDSGEWVAYLKDGAGQICGGVKGKLGQLLEQLPKELPTIKIDLDKSSQEFKNYMVDLGKTIASQAKQTKSGFAKWFEGPSLNEQAKAYFKAGYDWLTSEQGQGATAFALTTALALWLQYRNSKKEVAVEPEKVSEE